MKQKHASFSKFVKLINRLHLTSTQFQHIDKDMLRITLASFVLITFSNIFAQINYTSVQVNPLAFELIFTFNIPANDFIYKDYLTFTADSPDIELSQYQTDIEPIMYYDQQFGDTKSIYNKSFSATIHAKMLNDRITPSFIHITYYQHSKKRHQTELFALGIEQRANDNILITQDNNTRFSQVPTHSMMISKSESTFDSWRNFIQHMLIHWQAPIILCLTVFLIAILFLLPWINTLIICGFSLSFYILFLLLPWHFMVWLWAVCALCIGIYLLVIPLKHEEKKWYRSLIGILLIACSMIGFLKAYSYTYLYKMFEQKITK